MAMMEFLEQARRGDDYIRALEEERRKIEVFQRELPLCLQLITQAIESVRQQMSSSVVGRAVGLEENIPLRPIPTAEEEEPAVRPDGKPDWLRSVQLWNQEAGTVERPKKPVAVKLKKIGGAFQPFEREKYVAAMSSTAAGDGGCRGGDDGERGGDDGDGDGDCIIVDKDKERKEEGAGAGRKSQPNRKTRRSWSPELHRRFLHALHQLGGSHVATPKEIKEMMKVDGLTNDEIKSHLQKYRLHHRRPSPAVSQGSKVVHSCPPAPQFVLIGGILVQPPPEYTATTVAAAAVAPSGNGRACAPPAAFYAPVMSPSLPQDLILQQQQQNTKRPQRSKKLRQRKEERKRNGDGDDDDATNVSTSPTTSASSHTTSISA